MSRGFLITLAVLGLVASGCYHLAPRRAESAAPRVYAERYSRCHGAAGRGDGLAGLALEPRPRDFADRAWQETISDDRIRRTIREGGSAVGRSPLMPAHADLSARELEQLVGYIRQVGRKSLPLGRPLRNTASPRLESALSIPTSAANCVESLVGGRVVATEKQERWRPAWFLELEKPGGERVGVYFRGDRGVEQHGVYPLEHEYEVMRVLEAHGIPVPHIYGFCDEPRGIVMEKAPGRANLATAVDEAERRAVLDHYIEILAAMHRIPTAAFGHLSLPLPSTPEALALGDLPRWEKSFRARKKQPEPLIEFVLRWLHENAPHQRARATFLAGDAGQFLFDAGRVTRVIDLELAYLGDPLADLAGMMSRDLSEPLGDLSRGFRRYGELMGEPVDLPTVLYHAVRFAIVTPLATAPLTQAPPPGLNYVQYLGWGLVYGRGALDGIAQRMGLALEAPALPEAQSTRFSPAFAHAVALLKGPAAKSYEADVSLRLAQHLAEIDRLGPGLEAEDLAEVSALLGRRVTSWSEADAALEDFVLGAAPARTPDILQLLYRRTLRQEALLKPALRELDGVSIQKIRL